MRSNYGLNIEQFGVMTVRGTLAKKMEGTIRTLQYYDKRDTFPIGRSEGRVAELYRQRCSAIIRFYL